MKLEEIREYVENNKDDSDLAPDELDHVAMCMEHICKWYYEDYPLGSFLTAVVRNDLINAVLQADATNLKALKLYAWFLTWNLPADWREKANSEKLGYPIKHVEDEGDTSHSMRSDAIDEENTWKIMHS